MDIGKLKNNMSFYVGYEGEPEIILSIFENPEYSIHIWDGYFDDIFGEPDLNGKGWTGFTKDIHQMEGVFSPDSLSTNVDALEYLNDLMSYADRSFDYEETRDVLNLIADFLKFAIKNGYSVLMERN